MRMLKQDGCQPFAQYRGQALSMRVPARMGRRTPATSGGRQGGEAENAPLPQGLGIVLVITPAPSTASDLSSAREPGFALHNA